MNAVTMFLSLTLLVGPTFLLAERGSIDSANNTKELSSGDGSGVNPMGPVPSTTRPFSRGASTVGVSSLGAQVQFTTNLSSHMNMRSSFDALLWKKWITYSGFNSPVTVNLFSNNTSLDFYPFAGHGLRFSPGIMIHNPGAASSQVQLGPFKDGSFTLNGHTYYSKYTPSSDPIGPAPGPEPPNTTQGLQLRSTAFTLTTGWGNMLSRRRTGSWSFPVEAGVAFMGSPTVKTRWVQGQICDAQLQNCQDAATNPEFLSDLRAQFSGYKSRLDLLRTYPIVSVGVAYHHRSANSR